MMMRVMQKIGAVACQFAPTPGTATKQMMAIEMCADFSHKQLAEGVNVTDSADDIADNNFA